MFPSDENLVIETQALTKTYKGVQALSFLNLQVPQHSIFGFLGPNGVGKTTTIFYSTHSTFRQPLPAALAVIFERMRRAAREPEDDRFGNEIVYWRRICTNPSNF